MPKTWLDNPLNPQTQTLIDPDDGLYTFKKPARVNIKCNGYSDTARVTGLDEQGGRAVLLVVPDHGHLPLTREALVVAVEA